MHLHEIGVLLRLVLRVGLLLKITVNCDKSVTADGTTTGAAGAAGAAAAISSVRFVQIHPVAEKVTASASAVVPRDNSKAAGSANEFVTSYPGEIIPADIAKFLPTPANYAFSYAVKNGQLGPEYSRHVPREDHRSRQKYSNEPDRKYDDEEEETPSGKYDDRPSGKYSEDGFSGKYGQPGGGGNEENYSYESAERDKGRYESNDSPEDVNDGGYLPKYGKPFLKDVKPFQVKPVYSDPKSKPERSFANKNHDKPFKELFDIPVGNEGNGGGGYGVQEEDKSAEAGLGNGGTGFKGRGTDFGDQGFGNRGTGFKNMGTGLNNHGTDFGNRETGFGNDGGNDFAKPRVRNEKIDFNSHEGETNFRNRENGFKSYESGFDDPSPVYKKEGNDYGNDETGYGSQESGYGSRETGYDSLNSDFRQVAYEKPDDSKLKSLAEKGRKLLESSGEKGGYSGENDEKKWKGGEIKDWKARDQPEEGENLAETGRKLLEKIASGEVGVKGKWKGDYSGGDYDGSGVSGSGRSGISGSEGGSGNRGKFESDKINGRNKITSQGGKSQIVKTGSSRGRNEEEKERSWSEDSTDHSSGTLGKSSVDLGISGIKLDGSGFKLAEQDGGFGKDVEEGKDSAEKIWKEISGEGRKGWKANKKEEEQSGDEREGNVSKKWSGISDSFAEKGRKLIESNEDGKISAESQREENKEEDGEDEEKSEVKSEERIDKDVENSEESRAVKSSNVTNNGTASDSKKSASDWGYSKIPLRLRKQSSYETKEKPAEERYPYSKKLLADVNYLLQVIKPTLVKEDVNIANGFNGVSGFGSGSTYGRGNEIDSSIGNSKGFGSGSGSGNTFDDLEGFNRLSSGAAGDYTYESSTENIKPYLTKSAFFVPEAPPETYSDNPLYKYANSAGTKVEIPTYVHIHYYDAQTEDSREAAPLFQEPKSASFYEGRNATHTTTFSPITVIQHPQTFHKSQNGREDGKGGVSYAGQRYNFSFPDFQVPRRLNFTDPYFREEFRENSAEGDTQAGRGNVQYGQNGPSTTSKEAEFHPSAPDYSQNENSRESDYRILNPPGPYTGYKQELDFNVLSSALAREIPQAYKPDLTAAFYPPGAKPQTPLEQPRGGNRIPKVNFNLFPPSESGEKVENPTLGGSGEERNGGGEYGGSGGGYRGNPGEGYGALRPPARGGFGGNSILSGPSGPTKPYLGSISPVFGITGNSAFTGRAPSSSAFGGKPSGDAAYGGNPHSPLTPSHAFGNSHPSYEVTDTPEMQEDDPRRFTGYFDFLTDYAMGDGVTGPQRHLQQQELLEARERSSVVIPEYFSDLASVTPDAKFSPANNAAVALKPMTDIASLKPLKKDTVYIHHNSIPTVPPKGKDRDLGITIVKSISSTIPAELLTGNLDIRVSASKPQPAVQSPNGLANKLKSLFAPSKDVPIRLQLKIPEDGIK